MQTNGHRTFLCLTLGAVTFVQTGLAESANPARAAEPQATKILSPQNDPYLYWYSRGVAERKAMEDEAAVKSLSRAIQIRPDGIDALTERARVWQNLDQREKAKEDLGKALAASGNLKAKTFPGNSATNAALELAKLYSEDGQDDKAIKLLDLVFHQSGDAVALATKAEILYKKKDYKAALEAARLALKARPHHSRSLECEGMCLAKLGDYKAAEAALSEALNGLGAKIKNRGPRDRWRLLSERAQVFEAMGKPNLAAKDRAASSGDRDSFIEVVPFRSSTGKGK